MPRAIRCAPMPEATALLRGSTDYALCILDPAGHVSSWNGGAHRLHGYAADEILGRHFSCFYTADDRAQDAPAQALHMAATRGNVESEGWRLRQDGSQFRAYVVLHAIRLPDGQLAGFAKITRDLSEWRAAEDALRASQEQFRLLVQGVTDYAIYMISPVGLVNSWNAGAQRIKGYRAEEIVGTSFARFYTAEDQAAGVPQQLLQIARDEGRVEKEGWRVRKDGTRFWAHVVIDAVRDERGTLIGFAKVTRDITQQREARQALMQSQKMEAIGQLTGGVAHDFNNLLMTVIGSLELLRPALQDNERGVKMLENALAGARRGASLTQRLLSFARRQELSVQPVDLPALIRSMSALLERSLEHSVDVIVRYGGELPAIASDPHQLELAILNLVLNARDAMPKGGAVAISTSRRTVPALADSGWKPGEYVGVTVSDTGVGMDAETLRRATEPYYTTKQPGKGTGLGLSMVHGLAEQSGGRLELRSEPGKGTSATIWMPVSTQPAIAGQAGSGPSPPVRAGLEVLVVDDDELVAATTGGMLEALGHTALTVASAAAALAIVNSSRKLDLLLTDYAMPGTDGAELAAQVRALRPSLPITLVSGYVHGSEELAPYSRLAKPFSLDELAAVIDEAVPGRH